MDRARAAAAGSAPTPWRGSPSSSSAPGKTMPQWLAEAQQIRGPDRRAATIIAALPPGDRRTRGRLWQPERADRRHLRRGADAADQRVGRLGPAQSAADHAAVQRTDVREFAEWVQGIDWASVRQGAKSVERRAALPDHAPRPGERPRPKLLPSVREPSGRSAWSPRLPQVSTAIGAFAGVGGLGGVGLLGALGGVIFLTVEIVRHFGMI